MNSSSQKSVGDDASCLEHTGTETTETSRAPEPSPAALTIEYYTDPLCCWSWAFEPQWRRLRYEFGDQIESRYVMGGMIQDWSSFRDPINAVNRPAQMGPHWYHVGQMTGMPLDERIWYEDPPQSSCLPGIAVKAAQVQGEKQAERVLRRLREAVMLERRNIARRSVLTELAIEISSDSEFRDGLDLERFLSDLESPEVIDAFREDLKRTTYQQIGRFPSLMLRSGERSPLMIVGHRPYDIMLAAIASVAPDLNPRQVADDPVDYVLQWGSATVNEVAEALSFENETARKTLDKAVEYGELSQRAEHLYVSSPASEEYTG